jgi:hypothetical protein
LIGVTFSSMRLRYKIPLIAVYVLHVLHEFIPLILGNPRRSSVRDFTNSSPQLLFYANPALIYLGLSIFLKRGLIKLDSTGTPLSLAGIASQTAVHGIVAVFWALMLGPGLIRGWRKSAILNWPTCVLLWNRDWWPVVDNGIFAMLQGKLLWVSFRGRKATSKEGRHELQAMDEEQDEDVEKETTLPLTV